MYAVMESRKDGATVFREANVYLHVVDRQVYVAKACPSGMARRWSKALTGLGLQG